MADPFNKHNPMPAKDDEVRVIVKGTVSMVDSVGFIVGKMNNHEGIYIRSDSPTVASIDITPTKRRFVKGDKISGPALLSAWHCGPGTVVIWADPQVFRSVRWMRLPDGYWISSEGNRSTPVNMPAGAYHVELIR